MVTGASSRIVRLKFPVKSSPIEICDPKSQWNGLWMQNVPPVRPNNCRMIALRSSSRLGGRLLNRKTSSSQRCSASLICGLRA